MLSTIEYWLAKLILFLRLHNYLWDNCEEVFRKLAGMGDFVYLCSEIAKQKRNEYKVRTIEGLV